MPSIDEYKKQGIIGKYVISNKDGSPVTTGEFWVLRLDNGGSDPIHTAACVKAFEAYKKLINKILAKRVKLNIPEYLVSKVDGTPMDEGSKYFPLRLDRNGADEEYIDVCRKAVLVYARAIKKHLPKLSWELDDSYNPKAWRPEIFHGR